MPKLFYNGLVYEPLVQKISVFVSDKPKAEFLKFYNYFIFLAIRQNLKILADFPKMAELCVSKQLALFIYIPLLPLVRLSIIHRITKASSSFIYSIQSTIQRFSFSLKKIKNKFNTLYLNSNDFFLCTSLLIEKIKFLKHIVLFVNFSVFRAPDFQILCKNDFLKSWICFVKFSFKNW